MKRAEGHTAINHNHKHYSCKGNAMAQLLTSVAGVRFQGTPNGIFCRQSDSKARFSPTTAVSHFNIVPQILRTHTFIFGVTLSRSTNGEAVGPSSRSAALSEFGELRESRKILLSSLQRSYMLCIRAILDSVSFA